MIQISLDVMSCGVGLWCADDYVWSVCVEQSY